MKSTHVRTVGIFLAGAICATAVAGLIPREPITVGQWQERATVLIAEVEALGGYVATLNTGVVGIATAPVACVPPSPKPKLPANAVDPRSLRAGLDALYLLNSNFIMNEGTPPVVEVGKCKPMAGKG